MSLLRRSRRFDSPMVGKLKDVLACARKRKVSAAVIGLLEKAIAEQSVDEGMALLEKDFAPEELARLDADLKRLKLV